MPEFTDDLRVVHLWSVRLCVNALVFCEIQVKTVALYECVNALVFCEILAERTGTVFVCESADAGKILG